MKKIVSLFLVVCLMAGLVCVGAVQAGASEKDISSSTDFIEETYKKPDNSSLGIKILAPLLRYFMSESWIQYYIDNNYTIPEFIFLGMRWVGGRLLPSGIPSGGWFATPDEAAFDFASVCHPLTISQGIEYGATIYKSYSRETSQWGYTYTSPHKGIEFGIILAPPLWLLPFPSLIAAKIHTHPSGYNFSDEDISSAQASYNRFQNFQYEYLVTPDGSVRRYNPSTQENEFIYRDLDKLALCE